MDCRILEKPAFDIIGKSRKFIEAGEENLAQIPQFWNEFMNDLNGNKVLMNITQGKAGCVTGSTSLGVSMCRPGAEYFTLPPDFSVIHVPAATWAVFDSIGPMPCAIQEITKRIFAEWFPSTGYEHPEYELEVYLPGDPSSSDYHCQVWIHVHKNK
jgi:AraC family transcriptional regulator